MFHVEELWSLSGLVKGLVQGATGELAGKGIASSFPNCSLLFVGMLKLQEAIKMSFVHGMLVSLSHERVEARSTPTSPEIWLLTAHVPEERLFLNGAYFFAMRTLLVWPCYRKRATCLAMAGPDYVLATLSEARLLNQPLLSAAAMLVGNEEEGREAIYASVGARLW